MFGSQLEALGRGQRVQSRRVSTKEVAIQLRVIDTPETTHIPTAVNAKHFVHQPQRLTRDVRHERECAA